MWFKQMSLYRVGEMGKLSAFQLKNITRVTAVTAGRKH